MMNLATLSKVIQNKMEEEEAKITVGKKAVNGRKENGVKKEFRCEECGRIFPAKQNLGTHMRRYHKTEILVCPVPGCNKTYKHRSERSLLWSDEKLQLLPSNQKLCPSAKAQLKS